MKALSPDLARVLSLVAHTVGDLWALYARLLAVPAAPPDLQQVIRPTEQVVAELLLLRSQLAAVAAAPPGEDPELPIELARTGILCVLADHLSPAIDTLTGLVSAPSSLDEARVALECVLADRLLPAIDGLAIVLLLHEEGSARAYIR